MVDQFDRLVTWLSKHSKGIFRCCPGDLLQQDLRIRPRDRQARNLRDVLALRARGVLVGRETGSGRVAGVQRDELYATALHRRRVACGALGVRRVAVGDCDCAVVARIGVDEHASSTEFLRALDLHNAG